MEFYNTNIPNNLIYSELGSIYGNKVQAEMGKAIKLYEVYEQGADFTVVDNPRRGIHGSRTKYRIISTLIDKQARFLFSNGIDANVEIINENENITVEQGAIYQRFLNKVLEKNNFVDLLLKSSRDAFIGKRVACLINFNEISGITINFLSALEFFHDIDIETNELVKIIAYYQIEDAIEKNKQRFYKKKLWLEDGVCLVDECIYDGGGRIVEIIQENYNTGLDFIPAYVVVNDGLSNDPHGASEVERLMGLESEFSELKNNNKDSLNHNMKPIVYMLDIKTTAEDGITPIELPKSQDGVWAVISDRTTNDNVKGSLGTIETSTAYFTPLNETMNDIKKLMYESLEIPLISADEQKVTSGKALTALYYGLTVRMNEKMVAWRPCIKFICESIIKGGLMYPEISHENLTPNLDFRVDVDNYYALPSDDEEEQQLDIMKVNAQLMSKQTFLIKWGNHTPESAKQELERIKEEDALLTDSYLDYERAIDE